MLEHIDILETNSGKSADVHQSNNSQREAQHRGSNRDNQRWEIQNDDDDNDNEGQDEEFPLIDGSSKHDVG